MLVVCGQKSDKFVVSILVLKDLKTKVLTTSIDTHHNECDRLLSWVEQERGRLHSVL